ncbi:replication initiation protein RepC [Teichococcus oryzae]|uniref:Plasmid replication protein C C-terminal domain-containing protein n=1 Tax=Teichococcus oryzae TaxID=1608942 RepID=A0A5B2T977_9PROT|nr:replication initiation protein RepC [Pseudoroseomonas oryzae]KAA2211182.1 hypothetical protein F0Q34_21455 [Pseudoroseomonas oryzae]
MSINSKEDQAAHRQEVRMWRRECSAWSRKMLSLADHGLAEKLGQLDWPSLAAETQRLAAMAQAGRDPLELAAITARLRRLYGEAAQQLQAVPPAAESVESAPQDALQDTPITPTDQLLIAKAIAAAGGDAAPGGGRSRVAGHVAVQEPSGSCGGLLKGFPMSPALLLHLVPAYRKWVGSAAPSWSEIQRACDVVRGHLGIPSQVYGQARAMFGTDGAAVVIGTIAVKHAMLRVGNPAGYLRRMVERHRSGELNLDRTLHGLAAAARSRQRSVGSLRQSPR